MTRFILYLSLFISLFSINASENVVLTFAGDLMAHDINYRTTPLSSIYSGVKDELQNDDLSFINLEFPVDETINQTSYPSFNVHPSYVKAAIDSGFDVFSLANNHTNDYGNKSVLNTIKNMETFRIRDSIVYSGVYKSGEDKIRIETIQVKDMKIGFIAVAQFNNNYWNKEGARKIYITDYNNLNQVEKLEQFIKSNEGNFDCFILSYHGGKEYITDAGSQRKKFFKRMTDAGADIIWGHHPHVLQPWYKTRNDKGDKLVLYSMGNFVSGQLAIVDPVSHDINFAATGFSSLFRVELKMEQGKLRILKAEPRMIANVRNENNYFITVYKDVALNHPMSDSWKEFYKKMFPVAENRIREEDL